jgi:hypothetical protein
VPRTFKKSIVIAASAAEVFALTQDYGRRLDWDPFLRSAKLLGGATEAGLGVRAYCIAHTGLGMETEYVSFNPPRTCAVKMIRGPRLLGGFAASWRFEEIQPAQTRVSYHCRLWPRRGWLSRLLTPIIGWFFARDTRKRLVALKAAVEKGRAVRTVVGGRG